MKDRVFHLRISFPFSKVECIKAFAEKCLTTMPPADRLSPYTFCYRFILSYPFLLVPVALLLRDSSQVGFIFIESVYSGTAQFPVVTIAQFVF